MPVQQLRLSWKWVLVIGIVLIVLGTVALGSPTLIMQGIDKIIGGILIVSGLVHVYQALCLKVPNGFFFTAPASVIQVGVGTWLLFTQSPDVSLLSLLLTLLVVAEGAYKVYWGQQLKPDENWIWLTASAGFSLVFAILLIIQCFAPKHSILGLLIGFNLLVNGFTLTLIGLRSYVPGMGNDEEILIPTPHLNEDKSAT